MFHNCCYKAAASQIFSVDFILILYSDYCWEIFNILINSTKYSKVMPWTIEQKIFLCENIMILNLSRLFKQDREGSSISAHSLTGIRFSSWSSKNLEAHGTCEDQRATVSSSSEFPITQGECAHIINNFACHFQQCLQLNGGYMQHVLEGFS